MNIVALSVAALLVLLYGTLAAADLCTKKCDFQQSGMPITLCGTDLITHTTFSDAVNGDYCYAVCGVMSQYEGTCGCPNDCMSHIGQGECSRVTKVCTCKEGWGGKDCSLPKAGNSCSFHGTLVAAGSKDGAFPFDYCKCDEGFTGSDCSSAELNRSQAPWGDITGDSEFTSDDNYGDQHPIWTLSKLATIRVSVDEAEYLNLLLPPNLYNESYVSSTMHFDNGDVQKTLTNVGFRIKGAYSRMDQKKGWVIKFDEFVDQKLFDVKKIAMKAGSVNDDTILKTKLMTDFMRAMSVPVQRSSYALLYINEQFAGLYYLHEDLDETFLNSRIPHDTGKGNLMKYFWNVHLGYFGSNLTFYETKAHVNELGVPMYYYEQSQGNGDISDMVDWYLYLNTTSGQAFLDTIEDHVDVDTLLRAMVVESFMLATDNFQSGNNFLSYHRAPTDGHESLSQQWVVFIADFDECFVFDPVTHQTEKPTNILAFWEPCSWEFEDYNPLISQLLFHPTVATKYRDKYFSYYAQFVNAVFGASSAEQPTERYGSMLQFVLPWVTRDKLWQMSFGISAEEFLVDAEFTIANLQRRYEEVKSQLELYG
eukprot:gene34135-41320_t